MIKDLYFYIQHRLYRICDEEEEIPLYQRIKQTQSVPPAMATIDTGKRPSYNIDE